MGIESSQRLRQIRIIWSFPSFGWFFWTPLIRSAMSVRDGICVDPPLCRGTSQGIEGSRNTGLVCKGETVGKVGEVDEMGERTGACGQCQVRQGKRHDTRMTIVLGTPRCAIRSFAALEPRVFAWWNVIMLCNSVRALFVGVLFTHSVGRLEVVLTLGKFHQSSGLEECWEFQLLVFQWIRSQFDDDDEAVGRFPRDPL